MSPRIEFWYEFASTYSYPATMRVEPVARAAGVTVEWKPFLLGPIFADRGMADSPFNLDHAKGRYMWRDMARLCEAQGLPLKRPSVFPRNSLLATRVALVGVDEGWVAPFSRAVFTSNFARDEDITSAAVLGPLIAEAGGDPAAVLERAVAPENKARLAAQVDEARARAIFGAPNCVTDDGELFWGNDRLEQAVAWAANRAKEPA
ncbi:MAG TPA: 2-hydroxychromene-2-carboxylate isomerase [Caulobacteraceae bacterium]|jgi:2-hydroxychromene-2-carboxylate isomerase